DDGARGQALAIVAPLRQGIAIGMRNLLRLELVSLTLPNAGTIQCSTTSREFSADLGLTWVAIWANQRSRYSPSVTLAGSRAVPFLIAAISFAHSTWAWRLVPAKECQRRLRLPVCGSRTSMTMAQ